MDYDSPKLWVCIGCLGKTPAEVWNENDGLCAARAEGEWPKIMTGLPDIAEES